LRRVTARQAFCGGWRFIHQVDLAVALALIHENRHTGEGRGIG
jgi:hypothetical protein